MEERLQKIIASHGIASRRKAEELIRGGMVTINGDIATIGMKADIARDHIKVNGKLLNSSKISPPLYLKFYKPDEVITAFSDPEGRRTLTEFFKGVKQRVYPVGRLDFHSEGLLLLTNDGDLAYKILHPSKKIEKRYFVKIKGVLKDSHIEKLRNGIKLEDGITAPAKVKRVRHAKTEKNSWIEMIIYEGRKRQIRRMLERLKHPVIKLKRVSIASISLSPLKPGQWTSLTEEEIRGLYYVLR